MRSTLSIYQHPSLPHFNLLSIDAEFPIACDDEYWYTDNPKEAFIQPADKPSVISFFNVLLELNQILAFCMRTIVRVCNFANSDTHTVPVLDQQIEVAARRGWKQMEEARRRRTGFRSEQMDRLDPGPSYALRSSLSDDAKHLLVRSTLR